MSRFVAVGKLSEFRSGRGRVVELAGARVAVFRIGERWFALGDACPHMGLSLAEGTLEAGRVVCAGHGWSFDLISGRSDRRSGACAAVYETRIENDTLLLRAPESTGTRTADDEPWVVWDDATHARPNSDGSADGEEGAGEADGEPDPEEQQRRPER